MIQSFACANTHSFFLTGKSRHWSGSLTVALRKLDQWNAVTSLSELRIPPGNRLEALKANRVGQHSIRINDRWRLCFVWKQDGPHNVEIVDYH